MSVLRTDGLTKRYGETVAVAGVDLEVEPGETYALVGPNGSGKTTLIHMLAGLVRPSSGSIRIFDEPVRRGTPVLERVGVVHEDFGVYDTLSGIDHLRYFTHPDRDALEPDQALDMVGLRDAADRPAGEYSGGMIKRLGLALALVNDPDLLLLDEPFAALDVDSVETVERLILDRQAAGKSVVFSTHMFEHVERLCDGATILNDGSVLATGQISDLCGHEGRVTVRVPNGTAVAETIESIHGITGIERRIDGELFVVRGSIEGCITAIETLHSNGTPETIHVSYPALTNLVDRAGERA